MPMVPSARPTLFEYAGGTDAFLALSYAMHERCLADPELNHPFSHPGHPQHSERLAAYWAEALGGPPVFSRECGDHPAVLRMHAGNGDMGDLGERFVVCFVQSMDDARLPDDQEFRTAMTAYMEAATAEMVGYPDSADDVPPGAAMLRWGWDGPVTD
jgi:hemoglobin